MKHMRIVWKDTGGYNKNPFPYRGKTIYACGDGWSFDGDDNIYKTGDCAKNAVDKALGGVGRQGESPSRKRRDAEIIGKKTGSDQTTA